MRTCYVFSLPPLVLKSLLLVFSPLPLRLVAIVLPDGVCLLSR